MVKKFNKVLIPENNMGQLTLLIRGKYLVDAEGFHRVTGRPFTISEVEEKILELQASKRALADAILGQDQGVLAQIGRAELEALLG